MKKQTMSLAVASALCVGGSAAFGDMHINSQGHGEALIYPLYSAANANDTYIHIVNTTSYTKAVKVRVIEAQNSDEVLDFNLYLSPFDEFAAAITKNPEGEGAVIRTVDNSCTVPELGSPNPPFSGRQESLDNGKILREQPFVNFKYADTALRPNDTDRSIARTLDGYIEMIEMGQLDPTVGLGADAVHGTNGVPLNCGNLVAAWASAPAGTWSLDDQAELLPWDGGGLYGYGVLINVADGIASGYDAVAIETFNDGFAELHFPPGSEDPQLTAANRTVTIFDGAVANDYDFFSGQDAVSALFMTTAVINDYVIEPEINALTDWVLTMPTKKFYVNGPAALPPFSVVWNGTTACEPVSLGHWDREEAFVAPPTEGAGFSPPPPGIISEDFVLCTEVSVVTFGEDTALGVGDKIRNGFTPDYNEGWALLDMSGNNLNDPSVLIPDARELESVVGDVFYGLPVTGFAVFEYQNGTLEGGSVLANYGAASVHKVVTSVGP